MQIEFPHLIVCNMRSMQRNVFSEFLGEHLPVVIDETVSKKEKDRDEKQRESDSEPGIAEDPDGQDAYPVDRTG